MTIHALSDDGVDEASPLTQRLQRYAPLTVDELAVLAEFEDDRLQLESGEQLIREAQKTDDIFVLQDGTLHASTILKGGARQILRIHYPGDLVNITAVGWSRVSATITAMTAAEVSRFPRHRLRILFAEQPRLAALFYGVAVVDSVSLCDRLKSLGRTDGRARICTLLLELHSRQRLNGEPSENTLTLSLTQNDIADAVGMTKVHVNRLLKELTREGSIERKGKVVRLCDMAKLSEACDFVDRYTDMATDWLPISPIEPDQRPPQMMLS